MDTHEFDPIQVTFNLIRVIYIECYELLKWYNGGGQVLAFILDVR